MLANKIGADQQQAERSRVMQAENERQQNYNNQSQQQFNQTLAKVQPATTADAVTKEASDRTASDSALIDASGDYKPVTGSAPQEVASSIARATKAALDRNKDQARRNAAVGAVAGVNQKQNIELGRDANWQTIFGDNMRRSAQILPAELEDANRAGAGARGIGQILQLASTATGMAGMTNPTSWGDLFRAGGEPLANGAMGPTKPGFFRAGGGPWSAW